MLIKLRFIGLLLILVLNTSVFGENYNQRSFSELQQELTDVTNIVNSSEVWYFPTEYGGPVPYDRKEGISAYIHEQKLNHGSLSKYDILKEIDTLRRLTNNIKQQIRNTYIPQLKEQIKHHPDNPNNRLNPFDPNTDYNSYNPTPSAAETCHSIGKPGPLTLGNKQMGWKCHYYSNGQLNYERQYKNGVLHGTSNKYLKSGHPESLSEYWNGKLVRTEQYSRIHPGKMTKCWVKEADGSKTSCMPK